MMRTGRGLIIVWLLYVTSLSTAALVLDQSQTQGYLGLGISDVAAVPSYQEFTPTYDNLAQIDFRFFREHQTGYSDINVVLKDAGGTTRWNGTIEETSISTGLSWASITLNTPVSLVPEQTYRIELSSSSSNQQLQWLGLADSPYTRGSSDYFVDNHDYVFKTWAVPEPLTLSLVGLGILCLDRRRRLLKIK